MLVLHQIVSWLEGKKAIFLAIAAPVLSYLVTGHVISEATGSLLTSILSILAGSALGVAATQSYKDDKMLGKI